MSAITGWVKWINQPWLGVLSRTFAAILGGYALATAGSVLLARALPMPRSQAALTGMLAGIVLCACAALWVFATDRAWKAWAGTLGLAVVLFGIATLIGGPA